MNVINLTPHTINVCDDAGNVVQSFPPSGTQARCATIEAEAPPVNGVRATTQRFGKIEGLPAPQKDTVYLVSMVVGQAVRDGSASPRTDVYGPNTSPGSVVRDESGQIKGVKSFVHYA